MWRAAGLLLLLFIFVAAAPQQQQNPSPMVEHTRKHPRLGREDLRGRRAPTSLGTLFLPAHLGKASPVPLLIFFHGGTWLPEVAAARAGRTAVLSVQLGSGSGVYARTFSDPARLPQLLAEVEAKGGVHPGAITIGGWSAGCGAIREILRSEEGYARVDAVLALDGIHAGYARGRPGPLESELQSDDLLPWLRFAQDAVRRKKRFLITHTEIFPGTFASTTETADWLLGELGLARRPVLRWGPMQTQQLSEASAGGLRVMGFAGNAAPDHVDQLHGLADYLRLVRRLD